MFVPDKILSDLEDFEVKPYDDGIDALGRNRWIIHSKNMFEKYAPYVSAWNYEGINSLVRLSGYLKRYAVKKQNLKHISSAIDESKSILDREDNWDDDGAKKCRLETWVKATAFLKNFSENLFKRFSKIIEKPDIFLCPDGSIDILWQKETYRLLINIKENSDYATYYGDDRGEEFTKSTFNPLKENYGLTMFALSVM